MGSAASRKPPPLVVKDGVVRKPKPKLKVRWNRRCLDCDGSGWKPHGNGVVRCHCRYVVDLNAPKREKKRVEVRDGKLAAGGE